MMKFIQAIKNLKISTNSSIYANCWGLRQARL